MSTLRPLALLLLFVTACDRGAVEPAAGGSAPSPSGVAAAPAPVEDELASIGAAVKLVAQEYELAVTESGQVKDGTEYAEAGLFADQASLKYRRVAGRVTADAALVERARSAVDAVAAAVAGRRPPAEVAGAARAATEALVALGPAESGATAGLRAATMMADRAIDAEAQAGDYRVAVFAEPPRAIHPRGAADAAPPAGDVYLGVVLRERRTKRFLPESQVTAEWIGPDGATVARASLAPLWGDFPQYGANLAVPAIPSGTLRVRVEPPHHARHGDMLGRVASPAQAEFPFAARDGRVVFRPAAPEPIEGDYAVGDDILQAFAESRGVVDAGGYRIGFIAEAPEPFWLWTDGPQLKPVRPDDTHHLEVVLQDLATGLLVPGAGVTLTLRPRAGGAPTEVHMHPLLAAFQHYGETLRVAPGEYRVRVEVAPPGLAVVGEPRFLGATSAEFDWRAEPRADGAAS